MSKSAYLSDTFIQQLVFVCGQTREAYEAQIVREAILYNILLLHASERIQYIPTINNEKINTDINTVFTDILSPCFVRK